MNQGKLAFLKNDLVSQCKKIEPTAKGNWGVMNGQQMVEHFIYATKLANGKLVFPIINEGEKLEKMRAFIMSDIPFKENTKNPLLKEEGEPLKYPNMNSALDKLQKELNDFFILFESPDADSFTTQNPFFGELDYSMNVQLLHKHALHHLKQFGIEVK